MESYQLKRPASIKKRKRVGRGNSSGSGKTSGRGQNGQKSRSGGGVRPGFEGGQMPLQRRIPKRGFTNIFKKEYKIINVSQLEKLGLAIVDPDVLNKAHYLKEGSLLKILGNGEITKAVTVTADVFSQSAKEKIEKAGGKAVIRTYEKEKAQ